VLYSNRSAFFFLSLLLDAFYSSWDVPVCILEILKERTEKGKNTSFEKETLEGRR